MLINYGRKFSKQYDKADLKIKNAFKSKLKLFKEDPYHPLLNNHSFTGEYAGCRSINITGNWRAILSESQDKEGNKETTFRVLGTHPQIIWIKQPLMPAPTSRRRGEPAPPPKRGEQKNI